MTNKWLGILTTYFSFQGRLGRVRYFTHSLAVIVIAIIAVHGLPSMVVLVGVPDDYQLSGWLVLLSYGAAFLAIMSLMARRLHDIGLSGWWTPSVMLLYMVQGCFQELDQLFAAFITGTVVLGAQL